MFGVPNAPYVRIYWYLDEQDEGFWGYSWTAVVNTLLGHICQVYALAEQIARNWGFRRSNSQTLRKNTYKISNSRPMPKQHIIPQSLIVTRMLSRSLNFIDITNLNFREPTLSIIKIFFQKFVIFGFSIQTFYITAKFFIILIMYCSLLISLLI